MRKIPYNEYLWNLNKAERWEPIVKICFDGTERKFKPRGYDCAHYGYGIGGIIKCAAYPQDPRHGCPVEARPWRCKHFELKKNCG